MNQIKANFLYIIIEEMFGKINLFDKSKNKYAQSLKKSDNSESLPNKSNQHSKFIAFPKKKKIKKESKEQLQQKYDDLQGAKFRLLNEMLYTNESTNAVDYFKQNREDFQLYHQGYRHQSNKWEYRPVDEIIQYLLRNKQNYLKKNIVDLGCGEGFIYEQLVAKGFDHKRVKSYDLVSTKPFIKQADISQLPLKDQSVSVCIFCLSLMGTNYLQFIRQARRVLKKEGELIISEVESRSPNWNKFMQMVSAIGFKLINDGLKLPIHVKNHSSEVRFFRTMLFKKQQPGKTYLGYKGKGYSLEQLSRIILQGCTYKKR